VHLEGAPDGPAILYHPVAPATGLLFAPWVGDALARVAQLVSCDRPASGESTPAPNRNVAHAAADSAAIMDALGIGRFVTWGISGGGPHARACAALRPARVRSGPVLLPPRRRRAAASGAAAPRRPPVLRRRARGAVDPVLGDHDRSSPASSCRAP
jgi:pimeloyl-ACP methyl ester carboxylesterase